MNPDINLKRHCGRLDDNQIKRHRNLRKVSSRLDPDELDRLAGRESIRAKGAGWRTDFGPSHRGIVKFLEHRVGCKWDRVFSEVSHAFGVDGRRIVTSEVLTHTFRDPEGAIMVNDAPWCGFPLRRIHGRTLYVHPDTGLLGLANNGSRRYRRPEPKPTAIVRGGTAYFRRAGNWFSTPPANLRDLAARREASGDKACSFAERYALLLRRVRHLPTLWTEATGDFHCDPDATRQLSARRVVQLGLDATQIDSVA